MNQIITWYHLNLHNVICKLYINVLKRKSPTYPNKKGENCGLWRPCVTNAGWDSAAPQRSGCPAAGDKVGSEGGRCTQGLTVISGVLWVLLTLGCYVVLLGFVPHGEMGRGWGPGKPLPTPSPRPGWYLYSEFEIHIQVEQHILAPWTFLHPWVL